MISFYPGPSHVHKNIPSYVADAYSEGIMSINHRSEAFSTLSKKCKYVLKTQLHIPDDYEVFFVSSATECWQMIAQAYEGKSYHFYNGSFGEKWLLNTQKLKSDVVGYPFDAHEELKIQNTVLPEEGIICITQNETSNGTAVANERLAEVQHRHPAHLVAVDATSSMGGAYLNFRYGDIWYASVQKCFGLPSGLGLIVCSPRAIERALSTGSHRYYNSLTNVISHGRKHQTTHTPNVLAIYLLYRTLQHGKSITDTDRMLYQRFADYERLLNKKTQIKPFIDNTKVKSTTVLVYAGEKDFIEQLKIKAKTSGYLLGNGYGQWKETTFRIANFPALKKKEVYNFMAFLDREII